MIVRERSWMFVPGDRQRFLDKGMDSDADVLLFDLEDGVLPPAKEEARVLVARTLAGATAARPQRYVRTNAVDTPWFSEDLAAVCVPGLHGVCLPKVDSPATVASVAARLDRLEVDAGLPAGQVRVVAAIESAAALLAAPAIAASHPRLHGLMFGAEDYALDLGLGTAREGEAAELIYARSTIVNAAAASRVVSIDGVFPDLDDPQGLDRDVWQARRLGFDAKATFNPRQVAALNEVFAPQPDEVAYAQRIVAAFEEAERAGQASVAVGGQLVDRPILERAQRILRLVDEG